MVFGNENVAGTQDTLVSWAQKQVGDSGANPLNKFKGMVINMMALKHGIYQYLPAYEAEAPHGRTYVPVMTSLPTADSHRLFMDMKPSTSGMSVFTEGSNGYSTHLMYQQDLLEGDYARTSAMKQMADIESASMVLSDRAARDLLYSNPGTPVVSGNKGTELDKVSQVKGLYTRFNTKNTAARVHRGIVDFGGTNTNKQTSIWLIARGRNDVHLQYPMGHNGKGIRREHFANQLLPTSVDGATNKVNGYNRSTHDLLFLATGLVVRKWVCIIRGVNVPSDLLKAGTAGATLLGTKMSDMLTALERVESYAASSSLGTDTARSADAAFFCNNDTRGAIFKEIYKNQVGGGFSVADATMEKRNMMMYFAGKPIYKDDGILNTEAVVTTASGRSDNVF